ncbi:MAG: DUF3501 family protein [Proteobacteria bacterium]|nr:DUF3501 family protein [Pseudomonadota bacterium]
MPREEHSVTASDLMDLEEYGKCRKEMRASNVLLKKQRRLFVGPYVTVFFESFETMVMQIQEMLYIEKGGDAQLADELAAYNPMVPNGRELTVTLMFEIPDENRRRKFLEKLGGVENKVAIVVGDARIMAVPEGDVERSTEDGKASSVHFLHFPFTEAQIAAFRDPATKVLLEIAHDHYGHLGIIPPETRAILGKDFD